MMKKNLFVLMLSTFVLTNVQQSYAIKGNEVDENENEKKSSRVRSLLKPKSEVTKKSKRIIKVPKAVLTPAAREHWEEKIEQKPTKYANYEIEGSTLWVLLKKKVWTPAGPLTPAARQIWEEKIERKPEKYADYKFKGSTLFHYE